LVPKLVDIFVAKIDRGDIQVSAFHSDDGRESML
jgi:hypothetical protein